MHGTLNVRSTYKTSAALGFSQEEFDALAWFVDQYDAGLVEDAEIILDGRFRPWYGNCTAIPLDKFNMGSVRQITPCGTVGCILGWVEHRVKAGINHSWPDEIYSLFYFYHGKHVKAEDARDATVRVLRGERAWPR